jgi:hypothetical protein
MEGTRTRRRKRLNAFFLLILNGTIDSAEGVYLKLGISELDNTVYDVVLKPKR